MQEQVNFNDLKDLREKLQRDYDAYAENATRLTKIAISLGDNPDDAELLAEEESLNKANTDLIGNWKNHCKNLQPWIDSVAQILIEIEDTKLEKYKFLRVPNKGTLTTEFILVTLEDDDYEKNLLQYAQAIASKIDGIPGEAEQFTALKKTLEESDVPHPILNSAVLKKLLTYIASSNVDFDQKHDPIGSTLLILQAWIEPVKNDLRAKNEISLIQIIEQNVTQKTQAAIKAKFEEVKADVERKKKIKTELARIKEYHHFDWAKELASLLNNNKLEEYYEQFGRDNIGRKLEILPMLKAKFEKDYDDFADISQRERIKEEWKNQFAGEDAEFTDYCLRVLFKKESTNEFTADNSPATQAILLTLPSSTDTALTAEEIEKYYDAYAKCISVDGKKNRCACNAILEELTKKISKSSTPPLFVTKTLVEIELKKNPDGFLRLLGSTPSLTLGYILHDFITDKDFEEFGDQLRGAYTDGFLHLLTELNITPQEAVEFSKKNTGTSRPDQVEKFFSERLHPLFSSSMLQKLIEVFANSCTSFTAERVCFHILNITAHATSQRWGELYPNYDDIPGDAEDSSNDEAIKKIRANFFGMNQHNPSLEIAIQAKFILEVWKNSKNSLEIFKEKTTLTPTDEIINILIQSEKNSADFLQKGSLLGALLFDDLWKIHSTAKAAYIKKYPKTKEESEQAYQNRITDRYGNGKILFADRVMKDKFLISFFWHLKNAGINDSQTAIRSLRKFLVHHGLNMTESEFISVIDHYSEIDPAIHQSTLSSLSSVATIQGGPSGRLAEYNDSKELVGIKQNEDTYVLNTIDETHFATFNQKQQQLVLENTFKTLQDICGDEKYIGSTALVCVVTGNTYSVANLGDSRAFVVVRNKSTGEVKKCEAISQPHNGKNPAEIKRLGREKFVQGGTYDGRLKRNPNDNYGLANSGSLGDTDYDDSGITHHPDTYHGTIDVEADEEAFIVLASDGLTDAAQVSKNSTDPAAHAVYLKEKLSTFRGSLQKVAERLTSDAFRDGSVDNITVATVSLDKHNQSTTLTAVFDGHSGRQVSEAAQKNLKKVFEQKIKEELKRQKELTEALENAKKADITFLKFVKKDIKNNCKRLVKLEFATQIAEIDSQDKLNGKLEELCTAFIRDGSLTEENIVRNKYGEITGLKSTSAEPTNGTRAETGSNAPEDDDSSETSESTSAPHSSEGISPTASESTESSSPRSSVLSVSASEIKRIKKQIKPLIALREKMDLRDEVNDLTEKLDTDSRLRQDTKIKYYQYKNAQFSLNDRIKDYPIPVGRILGQALLMALGVLITLATGVVPGLVSLGIARYKTQSWWWDLSGKSAAVRTIKGVEKLEPSIAETEPKTSTAARAA